MSYFNECIREVVFEDALGKLDFPYSNELFFMEVKWDSVKPTLIQIIPLEMLIKVCLFQ